MENKKEQICRSCGEILGDKIIAHFFCISSVTEEVNYPLKSIPQTFYNQTVLVTGYCVKCYNEKHRKDDLNKVTNGIISVLSDTSSKIGEEEIGEGPFYI